MLEKIKDISFLFHEFSLADALIYYGKILFEWKEKEKTQITWDKNMTISLCLPSQHNCL